MVWAMEPFQDDFYFYFYFFFNASLVAGLVTMTVTINNAVELELRLIALGLNIRLKDGAYYCYCAYVLRILRYSGFLSVMLTNTGTFLHGLKISGKSRS